jgi:hypothetical protein
VTRKTAMSFPAQGLEKAYRNDIAEVSALLKERHGSDFLVYNLSERKYDYGKFSHQVWRFLRLHLLLFLLR